MDQSANPDFLADITGALDWWREAGVDCDFVDEPRAWLASPEAPADERTAPERRAVRAAAEAAAAETAPRLDPGLLPGDIDAFRSWWMSEALLDAGGSGIRVLPAGPVGAPLMVVVEEPEPEDREALLAGPQGRLLDAVLAAFGFGRDQVYLASALPRHTPGADWAALERQGIGQVLAHHVGLARPERLLLLGGSILPLIGHELPQPAAVLRHFNQEGRSIPMLASWGLPALARQPRAKAVLWKNWLEWTAA